MGAAPSVFDIETLGWLFWRDDTLSFGDQLTFLRLCGSCDAVAARMIADDRFIHRNGPLLGLMAACR